MKEAHDIIQELLDCIPPESEDADWWEDDFRRAVKRANQYLDEQERNETL